MCSVISEHFIFATDLINFENASYVTSGTVAVAAAAAFAAKVVSELLKGGATDVRISYTRGEHGRRM